MSMRDPLPPSCEFAAATRAIPGVAFHPSGAVDNGPRLCRVVLGTDRHRGEADRRAARKDRKREKGAPRWQRALGKGSARVTFVVGAMLTLPGASYLLG